MNLQDVIAILIVAGAAVYAARWMWKTLRGRKSCAMCGPQTNGAGRRTSTQVSAHRVVALGVPERAGSGETIGADRSPSK